MCELHCGPKTSSCGVMKCHFFIGANGRTVNLACGKQDHVIKHFLLCDHEICRNKSEAYWAKKVAASGSVNFIAAEDASPTPLTDEEYDHVEEGARLLDTGLEWGWFYQTVNATTGK